MKAAGTHTIGGIPTLWKILPMRGEEYSYDDTYFEEAEDAEQKARIKKMLSELTEVQHRRCVRLARGSSIKEIARREGASVQSVHESIVAARKKLKKYWR